MDIEEIRQLNDAELLELSLQRSGKYRKYTRDALKAQEVYCERKGNMIKHAYGNVICKRDMSAYSKY